MKTAIKHPPIRTPLPLETCQQCGNRFIVAWCEKRPNFIDFGIRYCPFCGLPTDEATGAVVQ